jgi:hypothetical protein
MYLQVVVISGGQINSDFQLARCDTSTINITAREREFTMKQPQLRIASSGSSIKTPGRYSHPCSANAARSTPNGA